MEQGESAPPRRETWLYAFIGIMVFTIGMMLVSFPVGVYTVFATHLSNNYTASSAIRAINYELFFSNIQIPVSGTLGGAFIVASAVYLVFVVLAAKQGTGVLRSFKQSLSSGYGALFTNPLAATLILLGATNLVTLVVDTAQTTAGVSTGSLSGDPFTLLVDFTLAPLLEESEFRLILIGIPVLLIFVVMTRTFSPRRLLNVLWRPSAAWDTDETEEDSAPASFQTTGPWLFPPGSDSLKIKAIRPVILVFLVLSSIMFGYAHYAAGSGWEPGKISEAALAGLALGYLFIKYGFHTNVLLHWSIDFVGTVYSFFGQGVQGVPWTSSAGSWLDVVPTVDMVFLLGVPSTVIVGAELLKRFRRPSA